jgi:hypothetical protein
VRYCDDLVILCSTKERAEAALAVLTKLLADLGLTLAAAKTHLVDLRAPGSGFDFLGFQHRRVESFTHRGGTSAPAGHPRERSGRPSSGSESAPIAGGCCCRWRTSCET